VSGAQMIEQIALAGGGQRRVRRRGRGRVQEPALQEHRLLRIHAGEQEQVRRGERLLGARQHLGQREERAPDRDVKHRDERHDTGQESERKLSQGRQGCTHDMNRLLNASRALS
jgi:hypothetical protein